ncbi:protein YdgV [unidentified bacterial endosymbiont]
MDNVFRTNISHNTAVFSTSLRLLSGEQHWHNGL